MIKFLAGFLIGVGLVPSSLYTFQIIESAQPSNFQSVAIDGGGNILLIDSLARSVTKLDAASGYAARETVGKGAFGSPVCEGVDENGNLFVADWAGHTIRKLAAADDYATVQSLAPGAVNFSSGCSLEIDKNGNIFVFDADSVKEILAPGGDATVRTVAKGHYGLRHSGALDAGGNIFLVEGGIVKEILAEGDYGTVNIIAALPGAVDGLALDAQGNIFITDRQSVQEIPADGDYGRVKILTRGAYYFPHGAPVDRNGDLFVADFDNTQVKELLAEGGYSRLETVAASEDGLAYRIRRFLSLNLGIGTTIESVRAEAQRKRAMPQTIGAPVRQSPPTAAH